MKFFKILKLKGFTLIEALVSMAVILVAVIGPLGLISNAINISRQERDRITAAFLAEEVVENFRAYRDGFVLACKDIDYEAGVCKYLNANILIDNAILQDTTNPRTISWRLFIDKLERASLFTTTGIYLDNASFNFSSLIAPVNRLACNFLSFNNTYGYNCLGFGTRTVHKRLVKLTKVSPTVLKVEVEVTYTRPRFFLDKEKSIKITEYIYER